MHFKTNWFDAGYEAVFRSPFFAIAANPVAVLAALHTRLSPRWNVNPSDLSVDSARVLGDVKARVSMFSGNGILDVTAEAFTAKFTNPIAPGDTDVIKDCIRLALDGLATLSNGKNQFREETVTVRAFIELLDADTDGPSFLRDLHGGSKVYGQLDLPKNVQIVPGYRVEFLNGDEKWAYNCEISRAHRSARELFLLSTTKYYEGSAISTIDEKADHSGKLLRSALSRAGLQMAEKK